MESPKRLKVYEWEDYHTTVWQLAKEIRKHPAYAKLDGLVAIARGGLVPATLLSHYLAKPIVGVISAVTYGDSQEPKDTEIHRGPEGTLETWLCIDDIIDSGSTVRAILTKYPKACFAASIGKLSGVEGLPKGALLVPPPVMVPDITWVKFPWEEPEVQASNF